MTIGVLKEPAHETRVSLLSELVPSLLKKGVTVLVESGAGEKAFCSNAAYENAGAQIKSRSEVLAAADIVLSIFQPDPSEIDRLKSKVIIGVFQPLYNVEEMKSWFMTAAGSIKPAKVLILGAGVAGLQAIATAKRLGAVVEVFDTRPAVKEEVMSLGAKFVEVEGAADASKAGGYAVEQTEEYKQKQQQKIADSIAKADIVITTAQIPGKKAPILITEEMIKAMRNGSVIIDIAAATGGNTPFTKNNETVNFNGVSILGNSYLPSTMPSDASKVYGKNVLNFLQLIIDKEGKINLNWEDDLVKGCCITHEGEVIHERVKGN